MFLFLLNLVGAIFLNLYLNCFFSHHISTIEGGMVVTNDEELYHLMLTLRAHGWTRNLPKFNHITGEKSDDPFEESYRFVLPGYNLRPLEFSGAHNPLLVVSNGEMKTIKGDSQAVGLETDSIKPFTKHNIKLQKNDMIYIYSDGYQDQFGGPKGKKYMVKRYRTFLKELSKLPIEEQGVKIQEEFHSWKGNHDQVDDICVMGIRV